MLLALTVLAFVLPAWSHPYGGDYRKGAGEPGNGVVGQRVTVWLRPTEVELEYVAEVPAARVYREAKAQNAGKEWSAQYIEALRGNVRVMWEGAPLSLAPAVIDDAARQGEAEFLEFHARGTATVTTPGTLSVSNGNYPDELSYFANTVHIDGGLVATRTSLLKVVNGRLKDNVHGAWMKLESAREFLVEVRGARAWERGEEAPLPARLAGMIPTPRWVYGAPGLVPLVFLAWWWKRR